MTPAVWKRWRLCIGLLMTFGFAVSPSIGQPGMPTEDRIAALPDAAAEILDSLEPGVVYNAPVLSPNGRHVAFIVQPENGPRLAQLGLIDLDAEGGPDSSRAAWRRGRVSWLRWVSDTHLAALVIPPTILVTEDWQAVDISTARAAIYMVDLSNRFEPLNVTELDSQDRLCTHLPSLVDPVLADPEHVLISMCAPDGQLHLWDVNVVTGARQIVERGDVRTRRWYASDGQAFMRLDVSEEDGRIVVHARPDPDSPWQTTLSLPWRTLEEQRAREDFEWAGLTDQPGEIYVRALRNEANFFGIHRYDLRTGRFTETIAERDDYDIDAPLLDPSSGEYLGYQFIADRPIVQLADIELQRHFDALSGYFGEQVTLQPISFGGDRMIFHVSGPTELSTYYVYDFASNQIDPVHTERRDYVGLDTQPVERISYPARDGLEIEAFVTWPEMRDDDQVPLIVMPHGGPTQRDHVRFDPVAQFLAAMGYAVVQPNFRGSDGYGARFAALSQRAWGDGMQADLVDAIDHLAEGGRVDTDRVCLVGFSYGGYAAMAGMALHPDRYRCAVSGGGVSDLAELIRFKAERYGDSTRDYWVGMLGDPDVEADRAAMDSISPIHLVDRIRGPLLLIHGAEDVVVGVDQSRAMAAAMTASGSAVVYLEEEGGMHHWGRNAAATRTVLVNIAEFLEDAMDGRLDGFEPVPLSWSDKDEPLAATD
ncbi:alpha/beta fold hydrolase [Maricaulis sp.]|uniref:alpha/beta hydrolase family protein n=1 Tax=Maricaulis sp. TaxID=1486257 RepID=UPI00263086F4|nr:alpha/beta fold hydrolase [Maricaulis sp.]MDF1767580.1 alpha/beta fold hydrolase [Maricaulis sp.]